MDLDKENVLPTSGKRVHGFRRLAILELAYPRRNQSGAIGITRDAEYAGRDGMNMD